MEKTIRSLESAIALNKSTINYYVNMNDRYMVILKRMLDEVKVAEQEKNAEVLQLFRRILK